MDLPLVLAGPILRRVEPNLVAVWLALSRQCTVELSIWEDWPATAGEHEPLASGPDPVAQTRRVGDRLHVVVVGLKLPEAKQLKPGRIYSYDLTLRDQAGQTHTLKSLGLLKDEPGKHLALGFDADVLPSFATCPPELKDLRLVHGSCRRASANLPDGLAWVDEVLLVRDKAFKDPLARPHQLFLTGDQIYADDVSRPHLAFLNDLSHQLIGFVTAAGGEAIPVERLPAVGKLFPADLGHFPAGYRLKLVRNEAGMTSGDGHSHLLSFGEFAAMYLSVWSNACWPDAFASEREFVSEVAQDGVPWFNRLSRDHEEALRDAHDAPPDPKKEADKERIAKFIEEDYPADLDSLARFRRTLPRVRRALANVPTYMMFDDHEVTDDWYLNPMWRDRVLDMPRVEGQSLGMTVVRNAMLAYALFQGWGNDPVKFEGLTEETKIYRELLDLCERLFPAGAASGPGGDLGRLDELLGVSLRNQMGADGRFAETNPPLKWHYSVPGEKHVARVLDCRTRRSFEARISPPGNISTLRFSTAAPGAADAQAEQLPPGPLPAGKEVLIVVASLQVLGPPVFDELLAPLLVRVFDVKDFDHLQQNRGTRGMPGTNPDAVEGWAFDPKTFEALLERLATYRRVVVLSGDVHYAASQVMSYWKKGDTRPAQIVQLTSSGLQNLMNAKVSMVDRSFAFAQRMIRAQIGAERVAWEEGEPPPLSFTPASALVSPRLRAKMRQSPALLPTHGWPKQAEVKVEREPDWSWRVTVCRDERPDSARPRPLSPFPLFPDEPGMQGKDIKETVGTGVGGYHRVANRHARQLEKLNNARQILFISNLGVVTFGKVKLERPAPGNPNVKETAEVSGVTHDLYAARPDPDSGLLDPDTGEPVLKPDIYVRHVAPLEHPFAQPPTLKPKT